MKCDLCGEWFEIDGKTYNSILLPDSKDKGAWRKNIRGAIKTGGKHICIPCLELIQTAIKICEGKREFLHQEKYLEEPIAEAKANIIKDHFAKMQEGLQSVEEDISIDPDLLDAANDVVLEEEKEYIKKEKK